MMWISRSTSKRPAAVKTNPMQEDPLTRAKTYPYPIPSTSFIFANGKTTAIEADQRLTGLADRTPFLGHFRPLPHLPTVHAVFPK